MDKKALIITSIAPDTNEVLRTYSEECDKRDIDFIVIGDTKSPKEFDIEGCDYYSIFRQTTLPFSLEKLTPQKHYSRKNLGYLIAIKNGCEIIQETDDDNIPYVEFWDERKIEQLTPLFSETGWLNVYSYFSHIPVWPRGYPLEEIVKDKLKIPQPAILSYCPIQQGLADGNPDVDAIFRLTSGNFLPMIFYKNKLSLGKNSWSPFNSQNTTWFKEAFPLMYLPSYCSFRMTDIWRSYVAQRIGWECGWNILFHEATVKQDRNDHNLMNDFEDEIVGYTNNLNICKELQSLNLKSGKENIFDNMIVCYDKLIEIGVIDEKELVLLDAWITDLKNLGYE